MHDYDFMHSIGEGAFGVCYQVREKESNQIYAIKALDKQHILKFDKAKHVYREKDILNKFNKHPFIIRLVNTF